MTLSLRSKDDATPAVQTSRIESLMRLSKDASPALERSINAFKNCSIGTFLSNIPINTSPAYQNSDDLLAYIDSYVSRLLGAQTACRVVADLQRHPMVLTANHHGVDYFAQSFQGSLLFSILKTSPSVNCSTVPIFACGNIPLNNLTYPRGALIYKVNSSIIDKTPLNLPLYSDKRKRAIVSTVEPLENDMIKRSLKRVNRWLQDNMIDPILSKVIVSILIDTYGVPEVLSQDSYSDQAVIINNRIWSQLFTSDHCVPELIYLEFERIVVHLLSLDLKQPNSLVSMLIMDDSYREKIINTLDETPGCWNQKMLAKRLKSSDEGANHSKTTQGCGTHFFWGIDDRGARFPLCLVAKTNGNKILSGLDDRGKNWSFDFNVSQIIQALANGVLVPSLFTSYMTVSFARAITCIGGYYQSSYLPKMQKGVVDVLKECGDQNIAYKIDSIPTTGYLSGMQAVTNVIDGKYLIPAGPFEIIASGGISHEEYQAISGINVYDAHIASLCDTVVDVIPKEVRTTEWKSQLFTEMFQQLCHCTICKHGSIIN